MSLQSFNYYFVKTCFVILVMNTVLIVCASPDFSNEEKGELVKAGVLMSNAELLKEKLPDASVDDIIKFNHLLPYEIDSIVSLKKGHPNATTNGIIELIHIFGQWRDKRIKYFSPKITTNEIEELNSTLGKRRAEELLEAFPGESVEFILKMRECSGFSLRPISEFKKIFPETSADYLLRIKEDIPIYQLEKLLSLSKMKSAFPEINEEKVISLIKDSDIDFDFILLIKMHFPEVSLADYVTNKKTMRLSFTSGLDIEKLTIKNFKKAFPHADFKDLLRIISSNFYITGIDKLVKSFPSITIDDVLGLKKYSINIADVLLFKKSSPQASLDDIIKLSLAKVYLEDASAFRLVFPRASIDKIIKINKDFDLLLIAKTGLDFPNLSLKEIVNRCEVSYRGYRPNGFYILKFIYNQCKFDPYL